MVVDRTLHNDTTCTLYLTVKDTGIGIPSDKLESIFESFAQSDINTTRKYGGTGLGLTITKKLIELQGGKIKVESEPGKGSAFRVEIPFKIDREPLNPIKEEPFEFTPFNNDLKILLVEDNAINQFVALKLLKNWDVSADVANNGKEALEYLQNYKYNLVLMDLQMPVMDGLEATLAIRSLNGKTLNSKIPIIGLSANAFTETKEKVIKAGMDDFTTKPIQQKQLYQIIKKYALSKT
ncbi:MAG: response regulator [Bacteroidales bacterium]|nr:response regulator [Bacteroidales bacterium]MCF8457779.1 response regulator [Bacteroidales bacterium]